MKTLIRLSWIFAIGAISLHPSGLEAQYFSTYFSPTPRSESPWGLCADSSGIYVVAGFTCNPGFRSCAWLVRFTPTGDLVWHDTLESGFVFSGKGMYVEPENLFVNTIQPATNERYLSRFDRWTGEFLDNGPNYSSPYSQEQSHGIVHNERNSYWRSMVRVLPTGSSFDHYRILVIDKTTRDITRELLIPLGEPPVYLAPNGLLELSDGSLLGVGPSCGLAALCGAVTRFDTLGNILWRTYLNQSAWHDETSLPRAVNLPDNRIGVLWRVSPSNSPGPDGRYVFYTLDTLGNILHEQQYPDIDEVERKRIFDMVPAANGDAFLLGIYYDLTSTTESRSYAYLARIGPLGELRWERKITDANYTELSDPNYFINLVELPNGDLIVLGDIDVASDPNSIDHAVWLLRLDSTGCLTPGCPEWQVITSTYESEEVLTEQATLTMWPNPTADDCRVVLPAGATWVTLRLYGPLGQLVRLYPIAQGETELNLSLRGLSPGVYTALIQTDDSQQLTGRLVIK